MDFVAVMLCDGRVRDDSGALEAHGATPKGVAADSVRGEKFTCIRRSADHPLPDCGSISTQYHDGSTVPCMELSSNSIWECPQSVGIAGGRMRASGRELPIDPHYRYRPNPADSMRPLFSVPILCPLYRHANGDYFQPWVSPRFVYGSRSSLNHCTATQISRCPHGAFMHLCAVGGDSSSRRHHE
jgi:hypothetical protein